jgi:hypothetical protein
MPVKNFCTTKETINVETREGGKKICTNHKSVKELVFKIYKECNSEKTTNLIKK